MTNPVTEDLTLERLATLPVFIRKADQFHPAEAHAFFENQLVIARASDNVAIASITEYGLFDLHKGTLL